MNKITLSWATRGIALIYWLMLAYAIKFMGRLAVSNYGKNHLLLRNHSNKKTYNDFTGFPMKELPLSIVIVRRHQIIDKKYH